VVGKQIKQSKKAQFPLVFLVAISIASCLPSTSIEAGSSSSPRNFLAWFALKAITFLFLIFAIQIFSRVGIYEGGITSKIFVGVIGLIAGISSGFIVHLGADLFSLDNPVLLRERILSTGIFSSLWITAIYWAGTNYVALDRRKNALLNSFFELERSTHSQSIYLEGLRAKHFSRLVAQTDDTTNAFSKIIEESKSETVKPDDILKLINGQVSKLDELTKSILRSERINQNRSEFNRSKNWSWRISDFIGFIRLSISQAVVPPYILALAIPATIALPLSRILDFREILPSLVALGSAIFITQFLIAKVATNMSKKSLNFGSFFIHSLLILAILNFNPENIVTNSPFSGLLKFVLAATLVGIISLLYHANRAQILDAELIIKEGAVKLDQDRKLDLQNRHELTRINKLWLQHIHGTVKSKVYAAALLIEKAEQVETPEAYVESLEKARKLLTSTTEPPAREYRNALEEIEFRIARWDGLVEIVLSMKVDDLDSLVSKPVVYADLIEEGITNAVRHGQCSSIEIDIYLEEPQTLVTEIIDNGVGNSNYVQGVGSALFETATNGMWSRTRDPQLNRTILRLEHHIGKSSQ